MVMVVVTLMRKVVMAIADLADIKVITDSGVGKSSGLNDFREW